MRRRLTVRRESWPLARPFAISRGVKTEAEVVVAEIRDADTLGRGECVPYPRYGESWENVVAAISAQAIAVADGLDRETLCREMAPGAARNALDAALWDLEAASTCRSVWEIAGIPKPCPSLTAVTISIGTPEDMGRSAEERAGAPLIKVKLDDRQVIERMTAVRRGAPEARLIIDPNEAWDLDILHSVTPELAELGVEMIEQPLPAHADDGLTAFDSPITLCADEACHTVTDLPGLTGKYGMVNIKLDKTGGLTEAIDLARAAEAAGFKIMVGCMVGTSLAMAPAALLGSFAEFVDLDGPLLLEQDRSEGLRFDNGRVHPPGPGLWG